MTLVTQPAIRVATPADIEAIMALERTTPTAAHWSGSQYEAMFQADAPPRLCLFAENGPLQAFLVAQTAGAEWELENIVVAPAARRQGLGRLLLRGLLECARQRHALAILLEVRASNAAARALYRACGFVEAGVRFRYYQNPQEDAIICRHDVQYGV
jgi:[ribosomal protein S18]-alanine N-acetyltransferase